MTVFALTAVELAGLLTGTGALVTALVAGFTGMSRSRNQRRNQQNREQSGAVLIKHTQGATVIMDATVRALNAALDRYASDLERERADRQEAQAALSRLRAETDAEIAQLRADLRDCREGHRGTPTTPGK